MSMNNEKYTYFNSCSNGVKSSDYIENSMYIFLLCVEFVRKLYLQINRLKQIHVCIGNNTYMYMFLL